MVAALAGLAGLGDLFGHWGALRGLPVLGREVGGGKLENTITEIKFELYVSDFKTSSGLILCLAPEAPRKAKM